MEGQRWPPPNLSCRKDQLQANILFKMEILILGVILNQMEKAYIHEHTLDVLVSC